MTFTVNSQLQIKLEFYIENIDLKAIPVISLYDIYCPGICQVLARYAVNLATFFILSQHVSQNCNAFIKRPNVTLEYLLFQLCIQEVLVSNLTQGAGHVH
jgi:hypothetical protein